MRQCFSRLPGLGQDGRVLWVGFALSLSIATAAHAGTSYVMTHRGLAPRGASTSVADYFVEKGRIRAASRGAPLVYVFEEGKVYVVDNSARSVQVATGATVAGAQRVMEERVKLLEQSAAQYPQETRVALGQMAADMRMRNERQRLPRALVYTQTDRAEVVDGIRCRIWEGAEWQAKQFEFCVAPRAAISGGAEILRGMQLLDQYWQGSLFAVGANIGNAQWWPGIAALDGVPILIREFKNGNAASETMLTQIRGGVPGSFDLPVDYVHTEVGLIP